MSECFSTATVTDSNNNRYRIEFHYDTYMAPPWQEDEGCGVVTDWQMRKKRPGELILNESRGAYRYYDFQASIKIARRDHWNSWSMLPTAKERGDELVRAVMLDYQRLLDWCHDKWYYMGIEVFPLNAGGDHLRSLGHAVWGLESDSDRAYIRETIEDLLSQCGAEFNAEVPEYSLP